jgi:ribonuclease HII
MEENPTTIPPKKPRVKRLEVLLPSCQTSGKIEVGIDECARGCVFGSTFIGAVVLPEDFMEKAQAAKIVIRDSKKMSAKQREKSAAYIKENAVVYSIVSKDNKRIDEINILQAVIEAMHEAITHILDHTDLDKILVDGNKFNPYYHPRTKKEIPHECIEKGDATYASIACASILCKVQHDKWIADLLEEEGNSNHTGGSENSPDGLYGKYGIGSNMGYLTQTHTDAIAKYGITDLHRQSFYPCNQYSANPKFKFKKRVEKSKVNEKAMESKMKQTLLKFNFSDGESFRDENEGLD